MRVELKVSLDFSYEPPEAPYLEEAVQHCIASNTWRSGHGSPLSHVSGIDVTRIESLWQSVEQRPSGLLLLKLPALLVAPSPKNDAWFSYEVPTLPSAV